MKRLSILILGIFFSAAAIAQDMNNGGNRSDDDFIKKAASGGMMEVELGKLAQEKAASREVKEFGEIMVREHSKANDEFKNIVQNNNIVVPVDLLDEHLEHIEELGKLSGPEFDKAYMALMVKDHKEDIDLFQEAAESHKNQEISDFAERTLPTLKEHYQKSRELNNKIQEENREGGESIE